MTDEQAVRMLRAVRLYCQPEHLPAVERAIAVLSREARKQELKNFC